MIIANSPYLVTQGGTPPSGSGAASGTASGIPWDFVTTGATSVLQFDNTHSIIPSGSDIMVGCGGTASQTYVGWSNANLFPSLGAGIPYGFRMSLYFTSDPSINHPVFAFFNGSSSKCMDLEVLTTGKIQLRDASGTVQATTTNSIPLNTRFRVDGWCIPSATTGQISLSLYSTEFATSPLETQTTAATLTLQSAITQVRFGLTTGLSNTPDWWMGNLAAGGSPIPPGALVQQMASGAPAQGGYTIISKPTGGTALRLKVATDAGLTQNVTWTGPQVPDSYGYVKHVVTGLQPHTQYHHQLADSPAGGTEVLVGPVGACKTLPAAGTPQNFTVSLVSCIDTGNNTDSPTAGIDDWVAWNADIKVFTGDFDYINPVYTTVPDQIAAFERQIISNADGGTGSMLAMMSKGWGFYCASDHDTGPDNGDSDTAYMPYNITARQEMFPMGPLGDAESPPHGLYQSWVAGRVRFILIDIRNIDRTPGASTDNGAKTMLGSTQLLWFFNQLVMPEPLKVVIGDTAWMGPYLGSDLDKWWSYSTERAAIISFVAANTAAIGGLMWWHGDTHGLGCTPGADNAYGGWPVYCAAPLKNTGVAIPNSGQFTEFYNNAGGDCRQYGRITVSDTGSQITVQFSGWDALNQVQQISQTDVFETSFTGGVVQAWNGSAWVTV